MKPKMPEKLTFMDLACPKNPTRRAFLRDIVVGSGSLLLLNRFLDAVLKRDDLEKKLTEYYRERGWDEKTGRPTPAKLKSLGLEAWV